MQSSHSSDPDIQDNRLIAAVGYLFILCLVPLTLRKDSKFAQFHGKQGLVLTIASVLLWFASFILGLIPILGWLVMWIGWITLLVLAIFGIMNAFAGKYWVMPFLGKYAREIKL